MEANKSYIGSRLDNILADIEEQNLIIGLLQDRLSTVLRTVLIDETAAEGNILPIESSAAPLEETLYIINNTLVGNTNKLTKLMDCLAV